MLVKLEGNFISDSELHWKNALFPIVFKEEGSDTEIILFRVWKNESGIFCQPSPKTTCTG